MSKYCSCIRTRCLITHSVSSISSPNRLLVIFDYIINCKQLLRKFSFTAVLTDFRIMIEVKTNSRISNRDHAACSADDVCIMYVLCIRNTAKTESIFNQFSITLVCHFMSHFVCMFVCLLMTTNRYYLRIENSTTISLNDRLLTELNCMQYIHSEMQGRCESIISYNYEYFGELFIVVAATHSVLQCLRCGCNAVVLVVPRAQHTHAHLHTQQKQRFSS